MSLDTAGERVFVPMNCDCGLTGGCEKCRPGYTALYPNWEIRMGIEQAVDIGSDVAVPTEVLRLIYYRVMAVARAKAKEDGALYAELVDAVLPLRSIVTNFGYGALLDRDQSDGV